MENDDSVYDVDQISACVLEAYVQGRTEVLLSNAVKVYMSHPAAFQMGTVLRGEMRGIYSGTR